MQQKITKTLQRLTLGLAVTAIAACAQKQLATGESPEADNAVKNSSTATVKLWPKVKSKVKKDSAMEAKIADMVRNMTVEQKVAQMIQPEIRAMSVEDMRKYGFGSYLNGGGAFPNDNKHATMADWVALADKLYYASVDDSVDGSSIPTMWGTDAVHGHNNVIGATLFPHNIGLGAMNNPDLMREIGAATAKVVEVTGIDWMFAPTVAVTRDDRWGRTYEAYSEDPQIVKEYATAIVEGIQGKAGKDFLADGKVVATAKHFLGDGGTDKGDDQGNNLSTEQELIDIHAQGYVSSIRAGVQTIMASFNSWHGEKMHGNKSLLTDVLKDRMGFDGLIVGDWDGHGQVKGCSNTSCPQAINAGVDIIMVPFEWKGMYHNTLDQVKSGVIPMARINDAVTRILRVKMRAGLFERGAPSKYKYASKSEHIGSKAHRDVAVQAVRESLVLLKNKNGILPLDRKLNVLVAGDGADNIGKQSGGWSISWQGTGNTNADFPGGTSIYKGIQDLVGAAGGKAVLSPNGRYKKKPDVAIVVYGENPYAEGEGDISNLEFQREGKMDIDLLRKLKAEGIPVVSVFISGRPMWVNPELNASDAFVAAWLPGSEGQGIADVLFKNAAGKVNHDFKGTLSFSWPKFDNQAVVNVGDKEYDPLFPYGFGLTYKDKDTLADNLSEKVNEEFIISGDEPRLLFKSRALDGLSVFLGDKSNWSVPVAHNNVTTHNSDNLRYKAVNWQIQEDARQITWKGYSQAMAYLAYPTPRDHSAYLGSKSALTLDIKVDQMPTKPLEIRISSSATSGGSVAIEGELKKRKLGEWKQLSIDLACFANAGTQFKQVMSPFTILSAGSADISLANISITPKIAAEADISCSK